MGGMSAVRRRLLLSECVSQTGLVSRSSFVLVQLTWTSETPASTSRRAKSTLWPKRLIP